MKPNLHKKFKIQLELRLSALFPLFFSELKRLRDSFHPQTCIHTRSLQVDMQPACTLCHNKMCPLHRGVLDKNSKAESHSHTLTCYIFLWIIEGTLHMILK